MVYFNCVNKWITSWTTNTHIHDNLIATITTSYSVLYTQYYWIGMKPFTPTHNFDKHEKWTIEEIDEKKCP